MRTKTFVSLTAIILTAVAINLLSCKNHDSGPTPEYDIAKEFIGEYQLADTILRTFENDTTEFTPRSYLGSVTRSSDTRIRLNNFMTGICMEGFEAEITDSSITPLTGQCGTVTSISRNGTNITYAYEFFAPQGDHHRYRIFGHAVKRP